MNLQYIFSTILYYHLKFDASSSFSMSTPFSVLDTPGKKRHMQQQARKMKTMMMTLQRQQAKIEHLLENAPEVTQDLSEDLVTIMSGADHNIQNLPYTSFKRLFWEQQV